MSDGDAPDPGRAIDVTRAGILTGLLGRFTPGKLADLATGTGWFAQIAADAGWQVTALDARRRDWPAHEGITWLEQDVRDADLSGYDLVLCLGIFYHLPVDDQLKLLAKCAGTPLIIDTHVSTAPDTEAGGYAGHMYPEPEGLLSAYGNDVSFWPSADSLLRMLADSGWSSVEAVEPWYHGGGRTFWTCLP